MYQQVATGILRASNWRLGVGKVLSFRAPPTGTWRRARNFSGAPSSNGGSSRVGEAHSLNAEPAQPASQTRVHQAAALGVQLPELCSGCGVNLQAENPDAPG